VVSTMSAQNGSPAAPVTLASLGSGPAEGGDYLRLHFNESPYGPPPAAVRAAQDELTARCGLYPDPDCGAIRERIGQYHGVTPDLVAVANGVDELILLTCLTFRGPAGPATVAVTSGTFPGYASSATVAGATLRTVPMSDDIPVGALSAALHDGADLAFVCNPHNPTGAALDQAGVAALLDAAEASGGVVVFDEAYLDFAGPDYDFALDAVRAGRRLVVLRTFSKAWGLASLRIGYAVGAPDLIARIWATRGTLPFNVNRPAQHAAAAALEHPEYVAGVRRKTAAARQRLRQALTALGVDFAPSVANFVLVKVGGDSAMIARELAGRHQILVRDLSPLGRPGCLRVTVGTTDQVDRFCAALADVLKATSEAAVLQTTRPETTRPETTRPETTPPETSPASAVSPSALFNGYIGAHVLYALHELGVLAKLDEGESALAALAPAVDAARLTALLRTMSLLGYVEFDGDTVTVTSLGRDLLRQRGYFIWSVGGHRDIWASLAQLTDGRAQYGHDVLRDTSRVAVGSSEADRLLMRPIQDQVCATIEFDSVADLGCGDGSRLIRICEGAPDRRGLGIDISPAACELATRKVARAGLADRAQIVQADIRDTIGHRTFPGIQLVMSIFMLHDLFAATTDHPGLIRLLRDTFPDARYFLLADTTTQPAYRPDQQLPIFSLGFELAHSFMDVSLQTRESYEAAFAAGGLKILQSVPFGAPSTWLFLLEAS
jgi:histidinol-phosphate aminotransferase